MIPILLKCSDGKEAINKWEGSDSILVLSSWADLTATAAVTPTASPSCGMMPPSFLVSMLF